MSTVSSLTCVVSLESREVDHLYPLPHNFTAASRCMAQCNVHVQDKCEMSTVYAGVLDISKWSTVENCRLLILVSRGIACTMCHLIYVIRS